MSSSTDIRREHGFTLIELVAVVIIIAILGSLAVGRIESLAAWKYESEIRKLANTWEMLFEESLGRGDSYRLILDIDSNSYTVRREVQQAPGSATQVDYLENFRLDTGKKLQAERNKNALGSIEDEFREEDRRQSGSLDVLFYQSLFADPYGQITLARPLQFPSLAEPQALSRGLTLKDVRLGDEVFTSGEALLRFSPRGSTEFAVVHLAIASGSSEDDIYTLTINPATGKVNVQNGYLDVKWEPMRVERSQGGG